MITTATTRRAYSSSRRVNTSSFWTLSFSGAGHLLPYHLGAASRLVSACGNELPPIRAVAGSSSGAIAATVLAMIPHRLEDYTDRFLQDGGYALRHLKELLLQEQDEPATTSRRTQQQQQQQLVVCTTRSEDGAMTLFQFDTNDFPEQSELLIQAVQASCTIPKSFHPYDVFSKSPISYPDGIEIDGTLYVDGGIVAPAPPTPFDEDPKCLGRVVVSPISSSDANTTTPSIRPADTSFGLPFLLTARCGTFQVRPSIQNLRAMIVSIGVASPQVLRDWYQRGVNDADIFVDEWKTNNRV